MRAVHGVLAAALAGVMAVGCGGSGPAGEPGPAGAGMAPLATTMEVEVGRDGVRLRLHVTNSGTEPVAFTFPTSQRYDFVVRAPDGREVWRWSRGMAFLQALSRDTLAAGASWDMEAVWDPGARTGRYTAMGQLTARPDGLEERVEFELP